MRTCYNSFGVLREYPHRPSYDPDTSVPEENLCNYPTPHPNPTNITLANERNRDPPWPFQNMSIYMLMEWLITGSSNKLIGEMDRLGNVLCAKEFKLADLAGFNAHWENDHFDMSKVDLPDSPSSHDGWVVSSVPISVPTGLKELGGCGKPFIVPGLHRHSLLAVIKVVLTDVTARRFYFSPFKCFWKSALGIKVWCFDEAYTSDSWLEAHSVLQKQRNEPGCQLEKVILGLMFWSDSTHVANFGTAKVWPLLPLHVFIVIILAPSC